MDTRYEKIIDLPHHRSINHAALSAQQRAAQFAPFAALTGYEEFVEETARLTEERRELGEDSAAELDAHLARLMECAPLHPEVELSYFRSDERKPGGATLTARGRFKCVDEVRRLLCLTDGREIPINDIYALEYDISNCP